MIVARLNGRLGHQMFIYATARMKCDFLAFDISKFKKVYFDYELDKLNVNGIVKDYDKFNGDELVSDWEYNFESIKKELRNELTIKEELDSKNKKLLKQIQDFNSVAIHIRRGDFVGNISRGNICNLTYYENAKKYFKDSNYKWFIFSDDIKWCKKNLNMFDNPVFVEGNPNHIDFELMKNCKHFIIANSSFSWWVAWLNENPDKIVCYPNVWNKHIQTKICFPEEWIEVDTNGINNK